METAPARPASNGLAVASLVIGIIGLCAIPLGLVAVILGHMALSRIKKSPVPMEGQGLAVGGLVTGYIGTAIALVFGIAIGASFAGSAAMEAEAGNLYPIEEAVPSFPELGESTEVGENGVVLYDLATSGVGPGGAMSFRVYVPPGERTAGAFPCVLVAPAGSNLLSGLALDGSDYHAETLPYAEAGFVTIFYSIDGAVEDDSDDADITGGYEGFRDAGAGVLNGRNALELARSLPFVDGDRVFAAGHSSAGTLTMLLASHLPDLAGAIAYAPALDLKEHFSDIVDDPAVNLAFPGFRWFAQRSSPVTHVDSIEIPVFLFYARDDDMVDLEDGRAFGRSIEDRGGDAAVRSVPSGGHYDSMVEEGIPAGIEWIRERL